MRLRKQRPNLSNSQRGELFARQLTRRVARYPNMDFLDVYEPNPGSPEAVCQNSRWQRAASQHPQEPLRVWAWGRMWKQTGINAVVAVTSVVWIMAVAWLIGDALWSGLAAL